MQNTLLSAGKAWVNNNLEFCNQAEVPEKHSPLIEVNNTLDWIRIPFCSHFRNTLILRLYLRKARGWSPNG